MKEFADFFNYHIHRSWHDVTFPVLPIEKYRKWSDFTDQTSTMQEMNNILKTERQVLHLTMLSTATIRPI